MKSGLIGLLLILLCTTAQAHHSFVAHFDMQSQIEVRGTVVDFKLRSPHSSLIVDGISYIDGVAQGDEVQRWEVESMATSGMRRMGVNAESFVPGQSITIIGNPNREPGYRFINSSFFITEDGTRFSFSERAEYESVDSDVLASYSGMEKLAGRWSSRGGFGTGMLLPLNERGRQAWEDYDPKLSPANSCEPMNFPDMFNAPYLFDLSFDDNTAVLYNEAWEITRRVPLNGQPVRPRLDGLFGVVRATMDGATLVLESGGYIPSRWGLGSATQKLGGGNDMPSSARKTLVERFSVSDDGQVLTYEYTLKDPIYLTSAYSDSHQLFRVADDTPLYGYDCEIEAAAMFSRTPGDASLQIGE